VVFQTWSESVYTADDGDDDDDAMMMRFFILPIFYSILPLSIVKTEGGLALAYGAEQLCCCASST
jgi:hypothetical protein